MLPSIFFAGSEVSTNLFNCLRHFRIVFTLVKVKVKVKLGKKEVFNNDQEPYIEPDFFNGKVDIFLLDLASDLIFL